MVNIILGIISSILLIAIGLWRHFAGKNAEKRKLADEAGKELENAQKNKDVSGRISAWDKLRRVR